MPLIAKPEHGTFFGLNGQREPDQQELAHIRELCGSSMTQMSHCQQCRADAVSMLGEDRSQEFNLDQLQEETEPYLYVMQRRTRLQAAITTQGASDEDNSCLVAVASEQGDVIDQHFGHAKRFRIYSLSDEGVAFVGERHVPQLLLQRANRMRRKQPAGGDDEHAGSAGRYSGGVLCPCGYGAVAAVRGSRYYASCRLRMAAYS